MTLSCVLDAEWECAGLEPGSADGPADLHAAGARWVPAPVPGTVASAMRAAGRRVDRDDLNGLDWWYRCGFTAAPGPHVLELQGVATLGDVWVDGVHVLSTANMHRAHSVTLPLTAGRCELVVRCRALAGELARRRQRPRWKTYLVDDQQLRWVRTSLLGRLPGWAVVPPAVGLWRPVTVRPAQALVPTSVVLRATCEEAGPGGTVEARFRVGGAAADRAPRLEVGGVTAPLTVREARGGLALEGAVTLPTVERWWPHTHGDQPLYEVVAHVGGETHRLGRVGFRTLHADRADGGFRLSVNGEPLFCRGACWMPPDPVSLAPPAALESHLLGLARDAGMNMLRVPGTTVYASRRFLDRCDELGILVWQDCMFAFMDPPDDPLFTEEAEAEVAEAFIALSGHPCVGVVCGNQEVEEVAAMFGLEPERRATPLFDKTIPGVAATVLPDVPYVASNPSGGDQPFRMGAGISQYFGVGGYLRPPEDARAAGVRFAAECLAFSTPPEPDTVERDCGGAHRAGHDPAWKEAVHHDAGRSWDMEDVRDHYVRTLFGVDPLLERYTDPERALELGRATNAHLVERVLSEWRRPGSSCDGALVLALNDLRAGAGWGLIDVTGSPKAPWYVLRRVLAPVAVLLVDEGLNGLAVHVVNDTPAPVRGHVRVELVAQGAIVVERGEVTVEVPARGCWSLGAEEVLGAWRDVTYAYRFAPPGHDAVVATLRYEGAGGDAAGGDPLVAQAVHLPLGQARAREHSIGLFAAARRGGEGTWVLDVSTERLAQWVSVRAPGFVAEDSWFHLPPGTTRTLELRPAPTGLGRASEGSGAAATGPATDPLGPGTGAGGPVPHGTVHALNAVVAAPISVVAG